MTDHFPTKCAPAERSDVQAVKQEHASLSGHICSAYFDFFPLPLLVLNPQRQIVFCNRGFLDAMGAANPENQLGLRPGEAMLCAYAHEEAGGCGTSEHCRECGALRAVLQCVRDHAPARSDCQLLQTVGGETRARDLRVFASPWSLAEGDYTVVTILDIADEKRRRVLERLFFHDILNSAGGARGLVDMLLDECPEGMKEELDLVRKSLFGMVEEIEKQKLLLAMESGEYSITLLTLQALEMVQLVASEYSAHPVAMEKSVIVDPGSTNLPVKADFALLKRVLGNMVKNALEATPGGGDIRMGVRPEGGHAVFWVQNDQAMPDAVKLQVFKRSFSTKGEGRGLGTYSIKLFTENYLSGEAGFNSSADEGTMFWIRLSRT